MREKILSPLNPEQERAVTGTDGAVLVLAGAGSGKTRVIAHRVAWLLQERHLSPHNLLAVTFTNKAAEEMRDRVMALLNKDRLPFLWIGTFHSICARILRADIGRLEGGYNTYFSIADADDTLGLVKRILKERGISESNFQPRKVQSAISRAKADALDAEAYAEKARTYFQRTIAPVYREYDRRLRESNSLDFDDLLFFTERLLEGDEEVRERYRARFLHLLVDEYQDTNRTQYRLLRLLASPRCSVFAVGDEDQSIYRWRGADIQNILDFQRDFPGAEVVKLERNYRSTRPILEAANTLVAHNENRLGKNLWTEREEGEAVTLFAAPSDREEAAYVADTVERYKAFAEYRQMAVVYRTNAQSRSFEEAFLNRRIAYQVVGGIKFYERREVKDVLSYLRVAANPLDRISLLRVLNVPPRGIGKVTVETLEDMARERGGTLYGVIREEAAKGGLPPRARVALRGFVDIMDALDRKVRAGKDLGALAEFVLEATGYVSYLDSLKGPGPDPQDRLENIQELVSAMRDFEIRQGGSLAEFLERQALVSDQDSLDASGTDTVKLLTLHAVKGLEFPIVFLTGLEEDLLPHVLSQESDAEVEEERRLCYVGMTRAMDRLHLTWARRRYVYGTLEDRRPSPFLLEIPGEMIREEAGVPSAGGSLLEAAQMLERKAAPKPQRPFKVGCRVHHPKFGFGIVLSTKGEGEDLKVTVSFNRHGRKMLLARMAKLEVL